MELRVLSREDVERVRQWRNETMVSLRTPFLLTKEMQQKFYDDVICNRNSNARYFGIWEENNLIGMCGISNIEWENGRGEISLILDDKIRGKGKGSLAIDKLLYYAFNNLRLDSVHGECYLCNPAYKFWDKIVEKYSGIKTILPFTKLYNGEFYDSMYFVITKGGYYEYNNP